MNNVITPSRFNQVGTRVAMNFLEEIYTFHKTLGLHHMQFIPCVESDPLNPSVAASYSVSAEQYGQFLVKIFDLWYADIYDGVAATYVRYFDSLFYTYVGLDAPDCTFMKSCGEYVVVEHNGDVYSCDFFVEDHRKLGNVKTHRLDDMLNSSRQQGFGAMKAALPEECMSCCWLHACRGGCTKDRIRDPRDQGSNHLCESYKMFLSHADDKLRALVLFWKQNQRQCLNGRR